MPVTDYVSSSLQSEIGFQKFSPVFYLTVRYYAVGISCTISTRPGAAQRLAEGQPKLRPGQAGIVHMFWFMVARPCRARRMRMLCGSAVALASVPAAACRREVSTFSEARRFHNVEVSADSDQARRGLPNMSTHPKWLSWFP